VNEKGVTSKRGFQTLIYPKGGVADAITEIGEAGYDGIEMFDKDFEISDGKITESSARSIGKLLKGSGLELACMGVGFLEDESSLGFMEMACEVVADLGGKDVFLLAPRPGRYTFDAFIVLASKLCTFAQRHGITPSIHNHVGTICETLRDTNQILSALQNERIGICFDNAHYMFYERDVAGVARALGKSISYVHLKDLRKSKERWNTAELTMEAAGKEFCDIGDGVADFRSLILALKDIGYSGWITVEIEKDVIGRQQHLSRNIARLNDLMK
jgi:sugar phosphate isomerase/epimerase